MIQKNSYHKESAVNGSYTSADIARILNVSRPTAVAFMKEGHFPVFEINGTYRVKKADFECWFEETQEV